MTTSFSARDHLRALGSYEPAEGADEVISILSSVTSGPTRVFFAKDARGATCVLVAAGKPSVGFPSFRTEGLLAEFRSNARISIGGKDETAPVLCLRCNDAEEFGDILAALVEAVVNTFHVDTTAHAWDGVAMLLFRWSDFFRRPSELSSSESLGLWGELWTLTRGTDPRGLLESWRGSDGSTYDFFRAGTALEVKTSTTRGVHRVSHRQVSGEEVPGVLLSIEVLEDPDGLSLRDLEARILSGVEDSSRYYEALRRRGVSPLAVAKCETRWSVVGRAASYRLSDVPRVLGFQPGVNDLRYTVTLPELAKLSGAEETTLLSPFELTLDEHEV